MFSYTEGCKNSKNRADSIFPCVYQTRMLEEYAAMAEEFKFQKIDPSLFDTKREPAQ